MARLELGHQAQQNKGRRADSVGMKAGIYLLSASSGVPNILALIFFRCFLIATFMASSRIPGTLWSVRSSLQRRGRSREKVVELSTVSPQG